MHGQAKDGFWHRGGGRILMWLTGGAAGPQASVPCFVLVVLLLVAALRMPPEARQTLSPA